MPTIQHTYREGEFPLPDVSTLPPDGGDAYNRLVFSASPYLLQHAQDPVDWYPWGDEAFHRAETLDLPVFLSIGYSTCHWCHVMQHESFLDRDVAEYLNQHFVSIKLDREERPDLDQVYMQVCQALTGSGGWPLTLFLAPDRRPFFAGTYFPRDSRQGRPGFLQVLKSIHELWTRENRRALATAGEITALLRRNEARQPRLPDAQTAAAAVDMLRAAFDARYGGFGSAPKFPAPHVLMFLMRQARITREPDVMMMVETTLKGMHRGGLFDQVGFGFYRYSTDRRWLVPHFEKMLYDNAMLLSAYSEAYQITGNAHCGQVVRRTAEFIMREFADPAGGFYSAENADSEGEEGKFYVFTDAEFRGAVEPEHADALAAYFGVTPGGNFELNGNILHEPMSLDAWCAKFGLARDEAERSIAKARRMLFDHRELRTHPSLDDKVLVSWNGLMIAALAKAGFALDDASLIASARRAADSILADMLQPDGTLLHRRRRGIRGVPGFLDDYAFLVWGLCELYRATFASDYLAHALRLHDTMWSRFADTVNGGLYYGAADSSDIIARTKDGYDGALPSGNSVAAWNALALAGVTGDRRYEDQALDILRAFGDQIERHPTGYTAMLCALAGLGRHSRQIVFSGDRRDLDGFLDVLRHDLHADATVLYAPPDDRDPVYALLPALRDYTTEMPAAFVCADFACDLPAYSPEEFAHRLREPS